MTKSLAALPHDEKSSRSGENDSLNAACLALKSFLVPDVPGVFPPEATVFIKALACELPYEMGSPLSRWSTRDLAREVERCGVVPSISASTVGRWLRTDAIKPWKHRCWIFPRDPCFAEKAGRILDLYEGLWQGTSLKDDEFVLSTDEKTSIQARARIHPSLPAIAGHTMKVEHEYERRGAWAYLAALDVHRMKLFGICEPTTGIEPFERLLARIMTTSPYREARRVFIIMDNGSSHRGAACVKRLTEKYPRLVPVHGPVHASWLNQIEIYFSILQRKVLTPNDFESLAELEHRILRFQKDYERIAKPFDWRFTSADLNAMLRKLKLAA